MKIINEAINATQYKQYVDKVSIDAVLSSVGKLKKLHGVHFDAEEQFENNKPTTLMAILYKELNTELQKQIKNKLGRILREKTGVDSLKIKFDNTDETDNANAFVIGTTITIANKFTDRIAGSIVHSLFNYCKETYSSSTIVNGLFRSFDQISKNDPVFLKLAIDPVRKIINGFVVVFLHELTHVFQNYREDQKNPGGESYTSYLSSKSKFDNAIDNQKDSEEYFHLYYASPQEIGAFAASIASRLIIKLNIDKITDPEKLPTITAQKIIDEIKFYIDDRYQNPSSPKEYEIFKRYAKLAYLEFQFYLELHRKKLLENN